MTQDDQAKKDGWENEPARQRFLESVRLLRENIEKLAKLLEKKAHEDLR